LEKSKGGLITHPHFAQFLIKGEWATLEEVLEWIKDAKGQAIIAHPARYKMTRTKLINDFKQQGGAGMEQGKSMKTTLVTIL